MAKNVKEIRHLNRQIPPLAHTSMYVWHKYWSRKTWNVVAEYIKTYSKERDIILDPFVGSGITAMEALKNNRRVIVSDLNPIATEITRLTITPISEMKLFDAFKRVEKKVKDRINKLYLTRCRNCGEKFPLTCAIWEKNKCIEIRYKKCPKCDNSCRSKCSLDKHDKALLNKINKSRITSFYPTNKFYYSDGRPFMKKEQYESVDELFTKRNLQALAWLMEAINEEKSKLLRDFLKIGFSSMVHLCSNMNPISEGGHFTPFSSAWIQHSYWYPSGPHMEQNVWDKFDSAINGHQGLLKAKIESNKWFGDIRFAKNIEDVIHNKADIYIYNGSCLDLMSKLPDNSIDFIFTDPPYDSSIQYGELSYMWVSWLNAKDMFVDYLSSNEIINNKNQHKDFDVYHSLLSSSFQMMHQVLKKNRYLSLTFHNPTFKVRNATIRAGIFAGFELQKIHHQELARPSAKSLLQPFGSAQGDFYIRFNKPQYFSKTKRPKEIDEVRFEKIVVDSTIKLLAERAEPTPYTIVINYIDPILAKNGYFSSLHTGLDINTVLKNHLNVEFKLFPAKIGGAEGELWWFSSTSIVKRLNEIPLSERVEQTVYRKLNEMGRVTFTEIWDAVSTEFPNSLTSDSISIKGALETYARQVSGGYWLLKPQIRERVSQHSEMIALLATMGKAQGYDIWIGKREQRESDNALQPKKLSEYLTIKKLKVDNASNQKTIENLDLLWIKGNKIMSAFEVESTTTMMSAIMRGSNIDKAVPKYMILPEERDAQFNNKMNSPVFKEHFEDESWNIIYFDALRIAYTKEKNKLDITSIINKKGTKASIAAKKASDDQRHLF